MENEKEYIINYTEFDKKKKKGISGLMRVRNDAEFIEESIESCIHSLDELIIVYNNCSDESPEIIKKLQLKYVDKIKYYEYKPHIYGLHLNDEEYEYASRLDKNSPNLLANYYNYALSKVSYRYVVKIDADQIYFTKEFSDICDAFRGKYKSFSILYIFFFLYIYTTFIFRTRIGISLPLFKFSIDDYRRGLLSVVNIFKFQIYLSGYNLFTDGVNWFVSLGKRTDNVNILPPYNGLTDHIVFNLTSKTYFVPCENSNYSELNSSRHSIIERFIGIKRVKFPFGFIWIHLNAIRRGIYEKQIKNFERFDNSFLPLTDFLSKDTKELNITTDQILFPESNRMFYSWLHSLSKNTKVDFFCNLYNYQKTATGWRLMKKS